MNLSTKLVLIICMGLSINVSARECDSDERSAMNDLAYRVGYRVAEQNQGENNIRIRLMDCNIESSINGLQRVFANIETTWNGAIFKSNFYNEDGLITVDVENKKYEYKTIYRNQKLKDWIAFRGLAGAIYFISSLE